MPDQPSNDPSPMYNTPIPVKITTPDRVESRIGTLEFSDGRPSALTAQTLFDHLDFIRGVEVFLNSVPAASLEAVRMGLAALGAARSSQVVITEELLDSNPLFLTGNTDTVYALAFLDLAADGPTVIEVPPGCGPGTVDDAWFRFVTDLGVPGPDAGRGGRYLIVPKGFDGTIPDGYFVAESPSSANLVIIRGFLVDGRPDAAVEMFRSKLRIFPLSASDSPPRMEFFEGSRQIVNTVHANDAEFYDEIDRVIQREPIDLIDPELRGLIASIGIVKGQPFAPDARMRSLLVEAAAVGNATARALSFQSRDPQAAIYPDAHWMTGFVGGDYRWLSDDGVGGRNLDARTYFFYMATVNTPAMALKMVGKGSQYALLSKDVNGAFLDGGRHYTLRLPAPVPAGDFWSLTAYDPQTRSELQSGQPYPSRNNKRDPLAVNDDGSIEICFGPTAMPGLDHNWIQTVPGKGWFTILRLYGPLEAWFDQSWRPGNLTPVD